MTGRITVGVVLVFLGLLYLMQNIGIFPPGDIIGTFWPLILIVIAVSHMAKHKALRIGTVILLLIGIWFQLNTLGIITGRLSESLWPMIIIFVGIMFIIRPKRKTYETCCVGNDNSEFVEYTGIFSENHTSNDSQNFKGGDASAVFGALRLDLSGAKLGSEVVSLNVSAVFGNAEVIVPQNCRLRVDSVPILGGCTNRTSNSSADQSLPLLHIKATAVLGNVDIHS